MYAIEPSTIFESPRSPFSSIKLNFVTILLRDIIASMLLYSKVLKLLSREKLYPISIFYENLLVTDPNKFEFFRFKVLFFGMNFSSLSLKIVASFISK